MIANLRLGISYLSLLNFLILSSFLPISLFLSNTHKNTHTDTKKTHTEIDFFQTHKQLVFFIFTLMQVNTEEHTPINEKHATTNMP